MELNGVFAPLPTPLTDDGSSISEIRLLRLLTKLAELGVQGYLACGEVGEFGSIAYAERKELVEMLLRNSASGPPVIVNVSALSTLASLDLAQHAARHGAKACVIMPPYYGALTPEEHYTFLRVVAQYAGLPVIVTDPNGLLSKELMDRLANVSGLFLAAPSYWTVRAIGEVARPGVDEFSLDPGTCTVLALLRPVERLNNLPEDDIRRLARFVLLNGAARVAKAAFELQGVDLGPLRGPRLSLAQPAADALRELLGFQA
jgi:4-hydroxy-tetrahydrodipicolinate synthase